MEESNKERILAGESFYCRKGSENIRLEMEDIIPGHIGKTISVYDDISGNILYTLFVTSIRANKIHAEAYLFQEITKVTIDADKVTFYQD